MIRKPPTAPHCSDVDVVLTSGGVGPTLDDVTMEAVAQAFGTNLVRCVWARDWLLVGGWGGQGWGVDGFESGHTSNLGGPCPHPLGPLAFKPQTGPLLCMARILPLLPSSHCVKTHKATRHTHQTLQKQEPQH